ncbi:tRNA glutamyl-Q(34) synthetase GluQRS [Pseudoalteromonas sp. MMG013]|uniref:tRNA glutamyl-Q(34) synthetase GluQRS n=1 Tax=unclassified Pseudoalteromonas TaxID=194690 RepID=UPI001B372BA3|nr:MULTISPECIES: tRNA glutamyl-Q(34) synthetase GluQRS [unclassified Pseudoalteromonas]MBQ4843945.1 tRNA glutamyl-Q(34) synthetase GluQRS [Pseudoalteromonas sp. MMG005]MBQ4863182.1 tRNA glutamyl-Q(34) synthetase GluQRS [Pseudoalteromonas sp. MMG013]
MLTPALPIQGSYRGRFAPSPSGSLHFGSLVAALASYLAAKVHDGQWLVRMEDIDTPRMLKGADSDILRTLDAFGLHWDGEVVYQSRRHDYYNDALNTLQQQNLIYACTCTRKEIKLQGGLYTGHCRHANHPPTNNALRIKQHHPILQYNDMVQGKVYTSEQIAHEDYIVKRRDGLYAYQLVVVLDDIDQGISHIVRGADLLEPTARQLGLFQQLDHTPPEFAHIPVIVTKPGFKLSKQNHAPAINESNPIPTLCSALKYLGVETPEDIMHTNIDNILHWSQAHFSLSAIPAVSERQFIEYA